MTTSNSELCEVCGRPLAVELEEWDDSPDLICFGPLDLKCSPPGPSIDAKLKDIRDQIKENAESRNHIEFDKLGVHIDALFGSMSKLSK